MTVHELGPLEVGHLVVALRSHRSRVRLQGGELPAGLGEFLGSFEAGATRCQVVTELESFGLFGEPLGVDTEPLVVTIAEAAAQLSASTRTVKRMLDDGRLTRVRVGSAVRIRVSELTDFINRQTAA